MVVQRVLSGSVSTDTGAEKVEWDFVLADFIDSGEINLFNFACILAKNERANNGR